MGQSMEQRASQTFGGEHAKGRRIPSQSRQSVPTVSAG
jgi:hypothetical protein